MWKGLWEFSTLESYWSILHSTVRFEITSATLPTRNGCFAVQTGEFGRWPDALLKLICLKGLPAVRAYRSGREALFPLVFHCGPFALSQPMMIPRQRPSLKVGC
jgi:hypothetical protein